MATSFQSSFIPREAVTEEVFKKKKAGFLGVFAVSLFISSIIVSIGVYFYKGILRSDIQSLQAKLAEAEANIDKETITEMATFGKKLDLAKSLVAKHLVVSNFLGLLSSSTVSSVQFTEFNYGDTKGGNLAVSLKGKTNSYASVALQENVLSQDKYIKSMTFKNLNLSDKGTVSFDLEVLVDPKIAAYAP